MHCRFWACLAQLPQGDLTGGKVVTVRWPQELGADAVRALWVQAQWQFSPFNGWPPSGAEGPPGQRLLRFADREAPSADVALALGVVSSGAALWEVQAQIIEFCSHTETDPAWCWRDVARLDPSGETWRGRQGIAAFLDRTRIAVPSHAVSAAARLMWGAFSPPTLDGLGYVIAGMAIREGGPDLDECFIRCGREDWACLLRCLAEG